MGSWAARHARAMVRVVNTSLKLFVLGDTQCPNVQREINMRNSAMGYMDCGVQSLQGPCEFTRITSRVLDRGSGLCMKTRDKEANRDVTYKPQRDSETDWMLTKASEVV